MVNKIKYLLHGIVVSLVMAPWLSNPVYAASATLSLSPTASSVTKGSTITININENSGSEPVNAVSAILNYPTDKLDFVSITSSSAFNIVAANSGGGGSVRIDRGALPAISGSQLVASVRFKAKVSSGVATVSFASGSSVVSSSSNSSILSGTSGGNYTLKAPPVATPPPPAIPKDTTPPQISNIVVSDITTNSATVSWQTSEAATSGVDYGLNNSYGLNVVNAARATDHKIVLNSPLITPNTTYHFIVKSADAAGNLVSSSDKTFTTKGVSLLIKVVDQNSKIVEGAKVTLGGKSGITDKDGQLTLQDLSLGKQSGTVSYKNQTTPISHEITAASPDGKPQNVGFKIKTSSTIPWLFLIIPLVAVFLTLLLAKIIKRPPSGPQTTKTPPTPNIIDPNQKSVI